MKERIESNVSQLTTKENEYPVPEQMTLVMDAKEPLK